MKSKIYIAIAIYALGFMALFGVLLMFGGGSEKNGLAASASSPEKIKELGYLKAMGVPYDIVMMITTLQNQDEATSARFIFTALEFMIMTENVYFYEDCDCDPEDEVCDCDIGWELTKTNTYAGATTLLDYLATTKDDAELDCKNITERLNLRAQELVVDDTEEKRELVISAVVADKYESTVKLCGITDPATIVAIMDLHEAGYFLQWLEESGGIFSGEFVGKYPMPAAGVITSGYGPRIHPITGKTSFHSGIDIGTAHHCGIGSVADGTVVSIGTDTYNGRFVLIYHGQEQPPFYSYYGHLSDWKVAGGDDVVQGEVIGIEGGQPDVDPEPGWSTGHHLHFEIWTQNSATSHTNPYAFLVG